MIVFSNQSGRDLSFMRSLIQEWRVRSSFTHLGVGITDLPVDVLYSITNSLVRVLKCAWGGVLVLSFIRLD